MKYEICTIRSTTLMIHETVSHDGDEVILGRLSIRTNSKVIMKQVRTRLCYAKYGLNYLGQFTFIYPFFIHSFKIQMTKTKTFFINLRREEFWLILASAFLSKKVLTKKTKKKHIPSHRENCRHLKFIQAKRKKKLMFWGCKRHL